MKEKYTPGEGCQCSAYNESECGCDVDWTPKEVYELKATIVDMEIRHSATMLHTQSIVSEANELREQRDRLEGELTEAREQCSNLDDQVSAAMMVIRGLERERDRLAEALERILSYQGRFCEEDPESIAAEALEAVEGGQP